jgi:TolB-like protein/class 3 adenylate cyclase
MASTRRLAAILAADVAGYSRLMGADEEGTHERLKAHFRELVDPKVEEHRGRIVKNTGDGFLAEFPSVVDAVRCAVEIQRGMVDREPEVPEERRIRFRIGVNLGDVIVEPEDIFGDGVNIAARVEALAEPGGICISRTVCDHIGDRLPYAFEDMGERSFKNIARPLRVYALRPDAVAHLPAPSMPPPAIAISQPAVAPRLSIVVLPFINLSNDPEQEYFADGITDDLTTDLSRIAGLFVISRNTAFTYKNKRIDSKQIGCELSVRYVLEGSVRRSGDQVRVNAQLIDAETDAHLWAERFAGDTSDLFALQNQITGRIAVALNVELVFAEAARPTQNPNARDYFLRGIAAGWPPSRERYSEQIKLFERALALAPGSVATQSVLAIALASRTLDHMTDTPAADLARANELAERAAVASPRNRLAHYVRGQLLRAQSRWQEAIPEYEAAIASNRNLVNALHGLAYCKLMVGFIDEAYELEEQVIRLSPRDPSIGNFYFRLGTIHLLQSRTDEATRWFEKARSASRGLPYVHAHLAASYALKGEIEGAAASLAEARRLSGDNRYSSITALKAVVDFGVPKVRALCDATYFAGLRKAGVPDG